MKIWWSAALSVLLASTAQAEPLSERAFLHRCYAHLTGVPLPLEHPFLGQLERGEATALDLCLGLVDSAGLDAETGRVGGALGSEAQRVLGVFYDLHRSWFERGLLDEMQAYNERQSWGSQDLFDTTEPALALTHALFAPGAKYRGVLEGATGWLALREPDPVENAKNRYPDFLMPSRRFRGSDLLTSRYTHVKLDGATFKRADGSRSVVVPMPQTVAVGELMGIVRDTRSFVIDNYSPQIAYTTLPFPGRSAANAESAQSTPGMVSSIDVLANHGSGILGLNSFMLVNWGHEIGRVQNGADKMARRWVQAFFSAMLCRELPLLRASDVERFVTEEVGDTVAPFRQSGTCVTCHATTDQLAAATRNLLISNSDADYARFPGPDGKSPKLTQLYGRFRTSVDAPYAWSATPVEGYAEQTPRGVLMFRSVSGALVEAPIEGIAEVGALVAAQPDMYRCAATRYLEHFTGLTVPLYDPGDPANFALSDSESLETKSLRRWLASLGEELRQTQSLRTLLQRILASELYRDSNYQRPIGDAE